jgi:hypothetical protein
VTALDGSFAEQPVRPRQRRRRGVALVAVLAFVVMLVIIAVVADVVTRAVIEDRASVQVESTSGVDDVAVDIHGLSVLWQLSQGTLDSVTLSSGSSSDPASFRVDVADVPTDLAGPTGAVVGTVSAAAETVNRLDGIEASGGAVSFDDGQVTYQKTFQVPIVGDVPVDVSASPTVADGGRAISFAPTAASLPDTSIRLDLTRFLGDFATTVCVAEYLPTDSAITGVAVTTDRATIDLASPGLDLSKPLLDDEASCS